MVKPFADAVVALKAGEYTKKPVQTQYGWHVIRLEETRDLAAPAFDSVRQRLEQLVQTKKFKAYTDELMKNAKIDRKVVS
jgi:peptidyl-prolyl cis-trans isomerase C